MYCFHDIWDEDIRWEHRTISIDGFLIPISRNSADTNDIVKIYANRAFHRRYYIHFNIRQDYNKSHDINSWESSRIHLYTIAEPYTSLSDIIGMDTDDCDWCRYDCINEDYCDETVDTRKSKCNLQCSSCYRYFCTDCSERFRNREVDRIERCVSPFHKYDYENRIIHNDKDGCIICRDCIAFGIPCVDNYKHCEYSDNICKRCVDHNYRTRYDKEYRSKREDIWIIGFEGEERLGTWDELKQWQKENGIL